MGGRKLLASWFSIVALIAFLNSSNSTWYRWEGT
uniref:Uncharacterized protein n=1 Tax=Anguilla anguilla TaxID=7936 RepID=A0A0E9R0D3_ANGAN